jgi:hypothetical protein
MPEEKGRKIITANGGVFNDLAVRLKLILRLMADSRINPLLKLLPIGSLLYFIIPDLALGPIDDVLIVWLGTYLFVELCPPQIVQEHMAALQQIVPGEVRDARGDEGEVIDAEFWEKKE